MKSYAIFLVFSRLITKIVHALENRGTCRAAIEVLVRAALDGRFPTVNRFCFSLLYNTKFVARLHYSTR